MTTEKLLYYDANATLTFWSIAELNMKYKKQKRFSFFAAFIASFFILITCCPPGYAAPAPMANQISSSDPLGRYNRIMYGFNDRVDILILKPIAKLYNAIMPKPLNQGIHNFFNNIYNVTSIVNDLLQFNFYQATSDIWRLGINTTIGIGGLFDVASRMNLPQYKNDFGLTMARWGWENSTFIVWPFFGASTLRDGIEIPVDYFYFSVYPYIQPPSLRLEVYGLGVIDRRVQLLRFQNVMEEAAFDKYVFVRNAYLQHRAYQINQVKHLGYKDRTIEPLPKSYKFD